MTLIYKLIMGEKFGYMHNAFLSSQTRSLKCLMINNTRIIYPNLFINGLKSPLQFADYTRPAGLQNTRIRIEKYPSKIR